MSDPRVGIQPIIFGDRKFDDPQGVLDEIRDNGYVGVESPNFFERFDAEEVKGWFAARDLAVPATHLGYGVLVDRDALDRNLDFLGAFGGKWVICSGTQDRTREGYEASARTFNEIGAYTAERGIRLLYHNHAWEFEDLGGGTRGIDILIEQTNRDVVGLNIDVYWVHIGGDDPAAFVRNHADRGGYFHFKDGRRGPDGKPIFAELGRGEVDLKAALEACLEVGAEWIVYEQDRTDKPTAESLSISRQTLRELGI